MEEKKKWNISLALIIGNFLFMLGVFWGGYNSLKSDVEEIKALEPAIMKTEITYIKEAVKEIKADVKELIKSNSNTIRNSR